MRSGQSGAQCPMPIRMPNSRDLRAFENFRYPPCYSRRRSRGALRPLGLEPETTGAGVMCPNLLTAWSLFGGGRAPPVQQTMGTRRPQGRRWRQKMMRGPQHASALAAAELAN